MNSPSPKEVVIVYPQGDLDDPKSGGDVRVSNLIENFLDHDVRVTILRYGPDDDGTTIPDRHGLRTADFARWTPSKLLDLNPSLLVALLKVLQAVRPDVVQVKGAAGNLAARVAIDILGLDTTVAYDAHDVEAIQMKHLEDPSHTLSTRVLGPPIAKLVEGVAVSVADRVLAVSAHDREQFASLYGADPGKVRIVPSGVEPSDLDDVEPRSQVRDRFGIDPEETVVVFHGSAGYYPNREAVDLIYDELAPSIAVSHPDVRFLVAGDFDVPERTGNATCVGYQSDIYSILNAADVAVVPLRRGWGTKIKLLDYLNVGLPIVTTEPGALGIDVVHGEHALVSKSVDPTFERHLHTLLRNEDERERLVTLYEESR